ncbi:blue (type 1) copper domain-containing protein [Pandoraea anapnoica]|uniref:Blue (Type 1) copper domain-containing protein n=1 Tax=Pandoraea anapnoica TaxID=2508301 RepID=A0A5E4ZIX9_9BURK|nr:cupredoxin family protein [Pandoraea anapnoica]VVE60173.1 blue (type 1) copper domain-containing protein [Pandoraea anapnoica]
MIRPHFTSRVAARFNGSVAAPLVLGAATLLLSLSAIADDPHAMHMQHGHSSEAAAIGEPGNDAQATRTVDVDMRDTMRFSPATLTVKRGDTVRFVVTNNGKIRHELTLGTAASLTEHAKMMQQMPGMTHTEPNAVTVEPGQRKTLVWHFTQAGTVDFACLEPGHFEAGMRGVVNVR